MTYTLPAPASRPASAPKTAYLIASGDLREAANTGGWPCLLYTSPSPRD